ncbi:MAG: hypothetical protein ABR899_00960 [Candidatus Krumholzibacteriaceae bacterium]|jgi:hypothetical protein
MKGKSKAKKPPGIRALRSGAGSVFYEWKTAQDSAKLTKEAKMRQDQAALNAALESLLLHARSIREFFRSSGYPTDILARDFLGSPVRVRMPYIRRNKARLDRRIVHLTYSRSRMATLWDVDRIMREIDDSMNRFIGRLEKVHPSIVRDRFSAL